MQYLLNAEEAGRLDSISIQEMGIPSLVLMERASLSLAERVRKHVNRKEKILVVCGMGNNGGDGVAAGRILMEWGYDISIFLLGNREKASPEMHTQLKIAENLDMQFVEAPDLMEYPVLLDAVFGIGLSREITGSYAEWIEKMNTSGSKIISVDIPSGVSAGTGAVLGTAVKADITVTFGENKLGLLLYPGYLQAGKVYVEDIGFPGAALKKVDPKNFSYEKEDMDRLFPKRKPDSHKGTYGKLLVAAGSEKISGAAFFAAKAAYLTGCGLVKVVTHENNRTMLQEKIPEALLSVYAGNGSFTDQRSSSYADSHNNSTCFSGTDLSEDIAWASAVLIGPGLGTSSQAEKLLDQILKIREKPVLIDADGINLLAKRGDCVKEGQILLPDNFILTPHMLEMSRLVNVPAEELKKDMLSYVKRTKNGAILVLKDARTLVSDGKQVFVNTSGNHALAKGGSGDVLSGIIGGLLARGEDIFSSASLGVYLHGMTAEEYIKEKSSSSMLASDILNMLPQILP